MASLIRVGPYIYVQWNDAGRKKRVTTKIRHHGLKHFPAMAKAILGKYQMTEAGIRHGLKNTAAAVPIEDAVERYLATLNGKLERKKITARSLANANHRVPILAEKLKECGIRYIQDGHKANCAKFMSTLSRHYKPSTCLHFAHLLSAIWNLYIKDELNPIEMRNWWHHRDVVPEQERQSRAVISNEDWLVIEKELQAADPTVRFVCMVGHFTGARLMACADILVNDFDHNKHTLTLPESKRNRVTVGCCDQLAGFLLDWPTQETRFIEPVAPNVMSARVSDFFARLRAKHPGRFAGISHHSFRRTFITRAFELGIPKAHSMELVGHKQVATHDLYKQKVDGVLVAAAQQIADSWGS
jgi:integrase